MNELKKKAKRSIAYKIFTSISVKNVELLTFSLCVYIYIFVSYYLIIDSFHFCVNVYVGEVDFENEKEHFFSRASGKIIAV